MLWPFETMSQQCCHAALRKKSSLQIVLCNIRGGSRGRVRGWGGGPPPPPPPPPLRDDLRFSNTTGILQKKTVWFIGVEVERETSALPPKKKPETAPEHHLMTNTKYSQFRAFPPTEPSYMCVLWIKGGLTLSFIWTLSLARSISILTGCPYWKGWLKEIMKGLSAATTKTVRHNEVSA